MEDYIYREANQKKIEWFLLTVYTLSAIVMSWVLFTLVKSTFAGVTMLVVLFVYWLMYVGKWQSYRVRAMVSAILWQFGILVYAFNLNRVERVLPVFMTSILLLGLFGIADIIYITVIVSVLLFSGHAFILQTISFSTLEEQAVILMEIMNVFFLQFILYLWIKRNTAGSKQLERMIDELKEVQSSKDDFLANVSHEIRTPLNTICGMSEIVLQEELSEKVRNSVQDIDRAGHNLMAVVRDLLDFSELISGKIELEEEAYNITSTINDIIHMAMARRNKADIEIIVDCDMDIPCSLLGDEKKLRRIIMNLVDNAIKFTPEGFISIGVHHRKEHYGTNLIISVKDTGIGISPENLERITASFTQADTSRSRMREGLGLGLSISNALVKKMGGTIIMKSRPGRGSMVQFVVPQVVLVDQPIMEVKNKDSLSAACYMYMEQFDMVELRDEYAAMLTHLTNQLGDRYHLCGNFAELQYRQENEGFTHIFTGMVEYAANREYFDELSWEISVVVMLEDKDEPHITNPKIVKMYKPFYSLSIVSLLNGMNQNGIKVSEDTRRRFYAVDTHILAVDDNAMNLRVIKGLLTDYRIKVTTALSGQEALEKVKKEDYDFIFMDHMMPEMDGVETMKRIRHMIGTYFQKVPIVALTANAVAGTREMLLAEGFTDFLEKPVERSILERVLKRNINPEKLVYAEEGSKESVEEAAVTQDEQLQLYAKITELGVDVKKGSYYCNGMANFLQVLEGVCNDFEETAERTEQLYREKDWKNYTIAVHGIKGSMASIGATSVSEKAKALELAGKENRIEFIDEHHAEMLLEYRTLFYGMTEVFTDRSGEKQEREKKQLEMHLPSLETSQFNYMIQELENAAYVLEEERMMEIVIELQQYQYNGVPLAEALEPVRKKIEMSDDISAAELAVRIKDKLQGKEN